MEELGVAIRLASATLRRHLLELAARALDVDVTSLEVADGIISSRGSNRAVSYWDLCGDRPLGIPIDGAAEIKPVSCHSYIGAHVVPREMAAIVTGTLCYVQDMHLPDMLHARLVRPPNYNARLRSLDQVASNAMKSAGSLIIENGSFLAVVNIDEYQAIKAADALARAARWDEAVLDTTPVFTSLLTNERISLPVVNGTPVSEPVPPLPTTEPGSKITLKARFERPYHMHGSIGPSAALAQYKDGRLTIWSHTQGIFFLRDAVADALGLEQDDVHVLHVPGPGCYGHNGADDVAFDAALVARALNGPPVLVKWTRADEHAWEPYGSAMVMDLQASLDEHGNVLAWSHETMSDTHVARPRPMPGRGGTAQLLATRHIAEPLTPPLPQPVMGHHVGIHRNLEPLYSFANTRLVKTLVRDLPLRVSALRTLGAYANVVALESFIDELAEAAGIEPVEFRLRNLADERAKAVITSAAQILNAPPAQAGRGRGLAFARYKNIKTYCAVGVEVEVTDAAEVKLHRVAISADAGEIVDPNGLTQQLEGGFMQAASWTLYEEVTWDAKRITSRDWDSYPILRFDNVPTIEVKLIDRPGKPFLGAGEAVGGPTGAAIANAIYSASGLRLRWIPFTPDNLRKAALE